MTGSKPVGRYRKVDRRRTHGATEVDHTREDDSGLWRKNVESKVDVMQSDVGALGKSVGDISTRVGTISKLIGLLVPIGIVAALSFAATAYAAFAKMEDDREQQRHHEQLDITQAHPGAAEGFARLREAQSKQGEMLVQIDRRLDHVEHRLDEVEQHLGQVDQRLDHVEQRLDRMEQSLGRIEQQLGTRRPDR